MVVSSVIMDVEPFYYLFISPNADGSLHGFFHTYAGVAILAILVGLILVLWRKRIDGVMNSLNLNQAGLSSEKIFFSSLFAAFSHVFLDSFMHWDLKPFWPFSNANPFLGSVDVVSLHAVLFLALLVSVILVFKAFLSKRAR